jgi:hypothetical protein
MNNYNPYDYEGYQWTSPGVILRTYFWVSKAGTLDIGIKAKVEFGKSELEAVFNNQSRKILLSNTINETLFIGSFEILKPGYYYLDLKGLNKNATEYANVEAITLGGNSTSSGTEFVKEDYFYWGRRGPSVHLSYKAPLSASDIVYFYSEVMVPQGNDIIGSFYMANGFNDGYFGMQVNSSSERRILFSVWSPYDTQDPNQIPPEYKVVLLNKGSGVISNDFGNEGSGGQSYLVYDWKAGNSYQFLLKAEPTGNNNTIYSAYFYPPEQGSWKLIAQWQRPFTNSYLSGLYSFLENFDTRTGPVSRQAYYNNQWIYDTNNQWFEITGAIFTTDDTGRSKARLDYAGGINNSGDGFYLKNCGFFSDYSTVDSYHERIQKGQKPEIDFGVLPVD